MPFLLLFVWFNITYHISYITYHIAHTMYQGLVEMIAEEREREYYTDYYTHYCTYYYTYYYTHYVQYDRRNPPPGVSILSRLGWGGGNINSGQRSKKLYREFLRWPEFIFPPPHPSLKECWPQGVDSYDHICGNDSRGERERPQP